MNLKSSEELELLRIAGNITSQILSEVARRVRPGVVPIDLNAYAESRCNELGVLPAFKGYRGFPSSICISINNQVVHTIPDNRPIQETDIVKLDFGVIYKGFYGDSAVSLTMPKASMGDKILCLVTKKALDAGIQKAKNGNTVGDVSAAIQEVVERAGFYVVKSLSGHGIGKQLHEEPHIPNFGKAGEGIPLVPGMVLALEPIVATGNGNIRLLEDGWTTETVSGGNSAHFEHTIAITDKGTEIFTL